MSILSDFYIATEDQALNYDGGEGVPESDRCQFRRLTSLEVAGLLQVLRGDGDRVELMGEFERLTPEDAEEWTMSVPRDMVDSLASFSASDIPKVAGQWSDITKEELGWRPEDFETILTDLAALAQLAKKTGKRMYFWVCL